MSNFTKYHYWRSQAALARSLGYHGTAAIQERRAEKYKPEPDPQEWQLQQALVAYAQLQAAPKCPCCGQVLGMANMPPAPRIPAYYAPPPMGDIRGDSLGGTLSAMLYYASGIWLGL